MFYGQNIIIPEIILQSYYLNIEQITLGKTPKKMTIVFSWDGPYSHIFGFTLVQTPNTAQVVCFLLCWPFPYGKEVYVSATEQTHP